MSDILGADDVQDVNTNDTDDTPAPRDKSEPPTYRIFKGSRIAVSSSVGKVWQRRKDAAIKAYEQIALVWDETYKYYNNAQTKAIQSPRGVFKRGDGTENVVFSNLQVMLPAVYSKNPDITCNTNDDSKAPFCKALETLINVLFSKRQGINAKPKVKKAVGVALLTNFGVLKIDWTKKDDSAEIAVKSMQDITDKMAVAKTQAEITRLYGELEALEMNMEVLRPSGPNLSNILPHNLIVDPYAEQPDGCDGNWMIERVFFPTATLTAMFTQADVGSEDDDEESEAPESGSRVLVYKPTHKAVFDNSEGSRDDGLGMVLRAMDGSGEVRHHTDDERTAYIHMYYTECYYVWDKLTKRVMLYQRDDWTWPLWVWDDTLNISRFFPYFIISYSMSTGGTVCVGESAYYLDQQDQINDINRKLSRMRSSIYDYWFYNSDITDSDEIEKMLKGLSGESAGGKKIVGIKAGEKKISDIVESVVPNMEQYKDLFDKQPLFDSVNRLTNISDALRGVQFKTNTNEKAVDSYQQSQQLSVGAKVDVVEDVVADLASSYAEMCVQNMGVEDVVAAIGPTVGAAWEQMSLEVFNATYSLEIVAGSMQKPNSVFKKQEAIQVAQSLGQFAQAAPGATLTIMLRVLEQAFTEVVIKPEDWQMLANEIAANTAQGTGSPTGTAPGPQGSAPPTQTQQSASQPAPATPGTPPITPQTIEQLKNLPPEVKAQIGQMHAEGQPAQVILAKLMQHLQGSGQGAPQPQQPQPAPQRTLQ